MSKLPAALAERLRVRQVVLVAGGRCAELAGLPGWKALTESLAEWVDEERKGEVRALLEAGRLVAALGAVRALLAEDVVAEVLSDAFPADKPVPPEIQAAARIPWRGVITTSPDDLWPRALAADAALPTIALAPGEPLALDGLRGRFLLPLFGRVAAPATLSLGPRDVRAKLALSPTGALLAEAHRRWSFVFVGFEAADPDLELLSGRLLGGSDSAIEHYLLCPGCTEKEAELVAAAVALTAVPLEGGLADALEELGRTWDEVAPASRPQEDDVDGWIDLWTRDPADEDAAQMVSRGAERLRREKSWERLIEVLIHRAELSSDKTVQSESLREVGRVFEMELNAPERAYRSLVTVLRLEPDDVGLVADLKRVARRANLWDEFVREYGTVVNNLADPGDTARHVLEMARIYAAEEGHEEQAIKSYETALQHDPGSPEALSGLEALYREEERWADLERVLRERESRATDPGERRQLRDERSKVLLEHLKDLPAAAAVLEAAVAEDPDDRSALRSLESLYKEQRREPERLAALEKLLPLAESDEERLALLRRIAAGHRLRGADGADAALAALEKAFALGDRGEDTLDALARAFEQTERWTFLAEVLDRWVEVSAASDAGTRAQLLARTGKVYLEKLRDEVAAEERYARALEADPQNPAVLSALASLSRQRGDYFRAAKFLIDSEERTRSPLEKARLLYEAGVLHQDRLEDEPRATELFARALAADPEHTAAAERLAPLYEHGQSWALLEPVLDLLVRKSLRPDAEVAELHRRLAECARKLGKLDKAQRSYEAARALTPESLSVLRGLADLHMERTEWADARALYETVRRLAETHLAPAERLEIYARLGRCEAHLDDGEGALRWFQQAVALGPSADEKARLLEEMGDLSADRLKRPDDAVRAYQEVLSLQPNRRPVLNKVLALYTTLKRWPGAVATLAKLAELEPAAPVRAKYLYASAVIHRDELGSPQVATDLFNRALDDDPEMMKAFEAVERLYTEAQDWKGLARAYRRELKRLPQEGITELRARLWNSLGVVSLRYLADREAAILALEVASSLDRENLARHELLADLYMEVGPSALEKAVAEQQFLVSRRPDRLESYQALAAMFQQMQAYDKLWCVAGVLSYLGKADHYLRSFWERHRLPEVPIAMGKIGQELWQKVAHPSEDPFIGALFALLGPALALTTAQKHTTIGVKRSERIELDRDDWFPGLALRYVANALELAPPDVFVRDKDLQTVSIYNLRDRTGLTPALVIGQAFHQWSTQWEVVFDLAKRMAFMRWERFPRFALATPAAIDVAVRAGLALGGSPVGAGPHDGEVERTRARLAELVPPPLTTQLQVVAKRFVDERGEMIDIPAWIAAADLSAARAAFVLSSDLPAAVHVLTAEPAGLTPLALTDRIKDLLAYSVSDDYFTVRHTLGLQVV